MLFFISRMAKVILVTGASGFLGQNLVKSLSGSGHIVYGGVRRQAEVETLNEAWSVLPGRPRAIKLDLADDSDYGEAVKQIIESEGRLDVLVNNAAVTLCGPVETFSKSDFLNILEVNAVAPFQLIKEILPHMKSTGGKIINISSLNGLLALPNFSLYSSSKFALEGLGLALRQEFKRYGIWVTNIEPGAISKNSGAKLAHVPARQKFPLMAKFLPMLEAYEVVKAVERVTLDPHPPARLMLGRDTKIMTFLQRILPGILWDRLLSYIWLK